MPEFILLRGEYVSLALAALLLAVTARPLARLYGLSAGDVSDLFWNGAIAFVVVGRIGYVALEVPQTLTDPFVLIRLAGGVEPFAGAIAVAAVLIWRLRRSGGQPWDWAVIASMGLVVATIGYDLGCVLRDACYGALAPPPWGFPMAGLQDSRMATPLIEAALLMALAGAVVRFGERLSTRTTSLALLAGLALVRASLTPASVLGREAVGVETALLLLVATIATVAGITWRPRSH